MVGHYQMPFLISPQKTGTKMCNVNNCFAKVRRVCPAEYKKKQFSLISIVTPFIGRLPCKIMQWQTIPYGNHSNKQMIPLEITAGCDFLME